jgi:2-polyprenyl-3-methyl-5-hydroxy-6-metoxy-1,4-benzoquinol methylase
METLKICPICSKSNFLSFKTIDDYFLTGEKFQLTQCDDCGFIFTNPRPKPDKIQGYYQSNEYFSHSKEKRNITSFLYNLVKSYSLKSKYRIIAKYSKKGKILDIGCATGEFLDYFNKNGWKTKGIEPAPEPRKFAKEKYGLDVSDENVLSEMKQETFDVITLWHVLEHVSNLNKRVDQIQSLIKANGIVVIALPNYQSWDAKFYDKYWAAYDVPRHLYHFSRKTIEILLSNHRLKIIETIPLFFDSFYVSLLSEKYKNGKVNYLAAIKNGFKSNLAAKKSTNYSSLIYIAKKITA